MKDLMDSYDKIKQYIDKNIKIPIIYVVFIINILISYFDVNISVYFKWFPEEFEKLILSLGNLIYSNFLLITGVISIMSFIIFGLGAKFEIPKENKTKFTDGQVESMNFISAYKRLLRLLELISTKIWILYTTFRLILGKDIGYFIKFKTGEITIDHILYILNIFILFYILYINLYRIKIPNKEYTVKVSELDNRYILLNKKTIEDSEYLIVRDIYLNQKRYFLISRDYNKQIAPGLRVGRNHHNKTSQDYQIINESDDISEIDYHFQNLENIYKR